MRTMVALVVTLTLICCSANPGDAQESAPARPPASPATQTEAQFFPWVHASGGFDANWKTGLGRFLLGVVGSPVTVYLFLGEFLPSMGGKTEYDLTRNELEDQKKRRDLALVDREKLGKALSERDKIPPDEVAIVDIRLRASEGLLEGFDRQIGRLEQEAIRERWRLFLLGFPMYILLGGFFAAAFALNAVQAVLIGFGWTAVADRIGLQKELAVKKELTREQINRVETASLEEIKHLRESNEKMQNQLAAAKSVTERITSALVAARPANPPAGP